MAWNDDVHPDDNVENVAQSSASQELCRSSLEIAGREAPRGDVSEGALTRPDLSASHSRLGAGKVGHPGGVASRNTLDCDPRPQILHRRDVDVCMTHFILRFIRSTRASG